jgi:ATP-dependent Clp protease adaptor protein ClpS
MTSQIEKAEGTNTRGKARPERPWNVILHNDWHNPINRVVWRLRKTLPGMTVKRATKVTWEVHTKGRAVAKTCHKELAELYEGRLRGKGLTVSIEPD